MSSYTKKQHYVWRYYLSEWEHENKMWCLRANQSEPFHTPSHNLGVQRFFYEFFELTPEDINYLDYIISQSKNSMLQELNRGWIETFQRPFEIRRLLKNIETDSKTRELLDKKLLEAQRTTGESLHYMIEDKAFPLIKMLKQQDTSFYEDVSSRNHFIDYISHQYFRTAKMRKAMLALPNSLPHDVRRTWPVEAFIYATNLASSIIVEAHRYHFVFLRNEANLSFITSDQPIINLAGHRNGKVDFYYPLKPDLAIIFTADKIQYPKTCTNINSLEVEMYNYLIYKSSDSQIYGTDSTYLKKLRELPKTLNHDI